MSKHYQHYVQKVKWKCGENFSFIAHSLCLNLDHQTFASAKMLRKNRLWLTALLWWQQFRVATPPGCQEHQGLNCWKFLLWLTALLWWQQFWVATPPGCQEHQGLNCWKLRLHSSPSWVTGQHCLQRYSHIMALVIILKTYYDQLCTWEKKLVTIKGRRCCLVDRIYSIPCLASRFALGRFEEKD